MDHENTVGSVDPEEVAEASKSLRERVTARFEEAQFTLSLKRGEMKDVREALETLYERQPLTSKVVAGLAAVGATTAAVVGFKVAHGVFRAGRAVMRTRVGIYHV